LKFTEDIYELIDRYLNNTMSDTDLEKWSQFSKDPDFLQEVELHQLTNQLVVEFEALDIKEQTKEIIDQKAKSAKIKKMYFAGLGAVLLLVGGVLGFSKFEEKEESKLKLVNQIVEKDTVPEIEQKMIVDSKSTSVENKKLQPDSKNQISNVKVVTSDPIILDSILEVKNSQNKDFVDSSRLIENKDIITFDEKIKTKPCEVIKFEISASPSCESKNEGAIFVSHNLIKGGEKPYLISIDNKKFIADNLISDLSSGEYVVFVKDKNGCVSSQKTIVKEKSCSNSTSKIVLNPRIGEVWEYENDEFYNATLILTSKNGNTVYEDQILDYSIMWNGKDKFGKLLIPGLYFYRIEKENKLIQRGELYIID